jgi:hypothetical protein
VLLTALAVVLTMLNAPRADAYTVVDHRTATGAERLDVRCGEAVAFSSRLPSGAKNVAVAEPRAGQVVRDGFGDLELARVEAVEVRPDPAGPLLEITVRGSGSTCDSPGGVWETGPVDFRVSYDLVSHPELRVSDDQAGMHAKRRPRGLTATSEAGWRSLRWRSWGRATATARGTFDVVRWVSVGHNGVDPRWVSYPVEVTLSRVRLCGQGYLYTRIDTRFTKRAPREVRRQAKPPGTASCLDG